MTSPRPSTSLNASGRNTTYTNRRTKLNNQTLNFDVVVIGAGAAGCVAAGTAALYGKTVCLLERNDRPARKVGITGKGRCNVTNNCPPAEFITNVREGGRFLQSVLYRFPPEYVMNFFEEQGVPLKTERGNRVFPVSDKAIDIVDALVRYAKRSGAKIIKGRALSFDMTDGYVSAVICQDGTRINCGSVIVATGGLSYPATGSTGDGYALALQAGHTLIPTRPSLVPLITKPAYPDLSGLSLKNVRLSMTDTDSGKTLFSDMGELLFTHFGVSGPLILTASGSMSKAPDRYRLDLDLKPGLDREMLDARVLRDLKEFSGRKIVNSLGKLLPKALILPIINLCDISPDTKVDQITREQRLKLVEQLKCFSLYPTAFRSIDEAVVTAGGVSTKELEPKTMRSKLVDNLYFAGEVIDCDAKTGGFNLQIAFSTGFAAGEANQ
ncbi:MAG: NAD(P)/FAD-dependent oxidoreductase [Oscillospiraceae bacterium]|nr:NAD(P)/FAD-dependent oxidoreductase [Oscillospiraceae bacterium]MBQ3049892.1 NAD(P)/FAD-dependent oxidoreductase [Oscillospiraceae bacterium]